MKAAGARSLLARLGLLLAVLGVSLAAAELILRVVAPVRWRVWPPGLSQVFTPAPGVMPGIVGESRFTINAEGMRGDLFGPEPEVAILAVGGSTTECLYLDDTEAWPQLLQQRLTTADGPSVSIGNVGRSGHALTQHVHQVERLLTQHPEVDQVILMVGVNDLLERLARDEEWVPYYGPDGPSVQAERAALRSAFVMLPVGAAGEGWHQHLALWEQLFGPGSALGRRGLRTPLVQDRAGRSYERWRALRRVPGGWRQAMPDLGPALDDFGRHVRAIVATCRKHDVRPIFVTQAALWSRDLAPEDEALLWAGGVGEYLERPGSEYYTPGALSRGLGRYNNRLVKTCESLGVDVFDLAAVMPVSSDMFYDDVHFTEAGSRFVADRLATFLQARGIR